MVEQQQLSINPLAGMSGLSLNPFSAVKEFNQNQPDINLGGTIKNIASGTINTLGKVAEQFAPFTPTNIATTGMNKVLGTNIPTLKKVPANPMPKPTQSPIEPAIKNIDIDPVTRDLTQAQTTKTQTDAAKNIVSGESTAKEVEAKVGLISEQTREKKIGNDAKEMQYNMYLEQIDMQKRLAEQQAIQKQAIKNTAVDYNKTALARAGQGVFGDVGQSIGSWISNMITPYDPTTGAPGAIAQRDLAMMAMYNPQMAQIYKDQLKVNQDTTAKQREAYIDTWKETVKENSARDKFNKEVDFNLYRDQKKREDDWKQITYKEQQANARAGARLMQNAQKMKIDYMNSGAIDPDDLLYSVRETFKVLQKDKRYKGKPYLYEKSYNMTVDALGNRGWKLRPEVYTELKDELKNGTSVYVGRPVKGKGQEIIRTMPSGMRAHGFLDRKGVLRYDGYVVGFNQDGSLVVRGAVEIPKAKRIKGSLPNTEEE